MCNRVGDFLRPIIDVACGSKMFWFDKLFYFKENMKGGNLMLYYGMKLCEILGLKKKYKMQVVKILIESMIKDKENDIICFYETELGLRGVNKQGGR